jgi:hypothetical protein
MSYVLVNTKKIAHLYLKSLNPLVFSQVFFSIHVKQFIFSMVTLSSRQGQIREGSSQINPNCKNKKRRYHLDCIMIYEMIVFVDFF